MGPLYKCRFCVDSWLGSFKRRCSPVWTLLGTTRISGQYNNYLSFFCRNSSYGYGVQLLNDHQRVTSGGSCISADQSQRPHTSLVPTTRSRSLHDMWLLASCMIMLGVQVCWGLRYTRFNSHVTSHHCLHWHISYVYGFDHSLGLLIKLRNEVTCTDFKMIWSKFFRNMDSVKAFITPLFGRTF